eukprot:Seg921.3 transcript_id=Seg921.3/GoldUCD/mRNA.D3Y31 product="hypothetical protein" protein_id=Seg921.3/GoldUCD/D3Y31
MPCDGAGNRNKNNRTPDNNWTGSHLKRCVNNRKQDHGSQEISRRSKPPERDDQPVEDARHWIKKRQDMQGLQKEYIGDEIGWGVINAMYSKIHAGSFVLHYDGELIDHAEALKRENVYSKGSFGSYMFYFKHAGQELWLGYLM